MKFLKFFSGFFLALVLFCIVAGSSYCYENRSIDPNTMTEKQAYDSLKSMKLVPLKVMSDAISDQLITKYKSDVAEQYLEANQSTYDPPTPPLDPKNIQISMDDFDLLPAEFAIIPPKQGMPVPFEPIEFSCGTINYHETDYHIRPPTDVLVTIFYNPTNGSFSYYTLLGGSDIGDICQYDEKYEMTLP
jgi:hypothetical protein